uniref:DNA-directed RNA polymerase subunit beta'' n=1 Tax=Johansenicoccus eremophilus TaxID=3068301 RepID=A0AA49LND0_9CHLO|nr:RNA polymerase beta'' subunit [Chlorophyceae sp. KF-2023a]
MRNFKVVPFGTKVSLKKYLFKAADNYSFGSSRVQTSLLYHSVIGTKAKGINVWTKAKGTNVGITDVKVSRSEGDKLSPKDSYTLLPFFWNASFDKGRLKALVLWFLTNHGKHKTINLLEKLKNFGFEFATKAGISLGIDDLSVPISKNRLLGEAEKEVQTAVLGYNRADLTTVEKFQRLIDTWHQTSEVLKRDVVKNFEMNDRDMCHPLNPVYMMAFSGARGNLSQVRQLVGMRGLMSDPQGRIIEFPIRSNFKEGLTLTEYIISSYGARKGIVDTALRTANAGYLTRRLVDAAQHIVVSRFDCQTTRGVFITSLKDGNKTIYSLENRLIGRVLARSIKENGHVLCLRNVEITQNLAAQISKKTSFRSIKKDIFSRRSPLANENKEKEQNVQIYVRSPLTCEAIKSVCQLCYGWSYTQGRLVSVGEAVGVIAAQSIGEPGTQLTMRTFHTGGVFSGDTMGQILAPFDGIIEYSKPIPGTLVRTPRGNIALLTKAANSFGIRGEFKFVEFQIPMFTLLFLKNKEKANFKQLLAEFSTIAISGGMQEDVEETLLSELEGELDAGNTNILKKEDDFGDLSVRAWEWSCVRILAGKIYRLPVDAFYIPKVGDYIRSNVPMARLLWKTPETSFAGNAYVTYASPLHSKEGDKATAKDLNFSDKNTYKSRKKRWSFAPSKNRGQKRKMQLSLSNPPKHPYYGTYKFQFPLSLLPKVTIGDQAFRYCESNRTGQQKKIIRVKKTSETLAHVSASLRKAIYSASISNLRYRNGAYTFMAFSSPQQGSLTNYNKSKFFASFVSLSSFNDYNHIYMCEQSRQLNIPKKQADKVSVFFNSTLSDFSVKINPSLYLNNKIKIGDGAKEQRWQKPNNLHNCIWMYELTSKVLYSATHDIYMYHALRHSTVAYITKGDKATAKGPDFTPSGDFGKIKTALLEPFASFAIAQGHHKRSGEVPLQYIYFPLYGQNKTIGLCPPGGPFAIATFAGAKATEAIGKVKLKKKTKTSKVKSSNEWDSPKYSTLKKSTMAFFMINGTYKYRSSRLELSIVTNLVENKTRNLNTSVLSFNFSKRKQKMLKQMDRSISSTITDCDFISTHSNLSSNLGGKKKVNTSYPLRFNHSNLSQLNQQSFYVQSSEGTFPVATLAVTQELGYCESNSEHINIKKEGAQKTKFNALFKAFRSTSSNTAYAKHIKNVAILLPQNKKKEGDCFVNKIKYVYKRDYLGLALLTDIFLKVERDYKLTHFITESKFKQGWIYLPHRNKHSFRLSENEGKTFNSIDRKGRIFSDYISAFYYPNVSTGAFTQAQVNFNNKTSLSLVFVPSYRSNFLTSKLFKQKVKRKKRSYIVSKQMAGLLFNTSDKNMENQNKSSLNGVVNVNTLELNKESFSFYYPNDGTYKYSTGAFAQGKGSTKQSPYQSRYSPISPPLPCLNIISLDKIEKSKTKQFYKVLSKHNQPQLFGHSKIAKYRWPQNLKNLMSIRLNDNKINKNTLLILFQKIEIDNIFKKLPPLSILNKENVPSPKDNIYMCHPYPTLWYKSSQKLNKPKQTKENIFKSFKTGKNIENPGPKILNFVKFKTNKENAFFSPATQSKVVPQQYLYLPLFGIKRKKWFKGQSNIAKRVVTLVFSNKQSFSKPFFTLASAPEATYGGQAIETTNFPLGQKQGLKIREAVLPKDPTQKYRISFPSSLVQVSKNKETQLQIKTAKGLSSPHLGALKIGISLFQNKDKNSLFTLVQSKTAKEAIKKQNESAHTKTRVLKNQKCCFYLQQPFFNQDLPNVFGKGLIGHDIYKYARLLYFVYAKDKRKTLVNQKQRHSLSPIASVAFATAKVAIAKGERWQKLKQVKNLKLSSSPLAGVKVRGERWLKSYPSPTLVKTSRFSFTKGQYTLCQLLGQKKVIKKWRDSSKIYFKRKTEKSKNRKKFTPKFLNGHESVETLFLKQTYFSGLFNLPLFSLSSMLRTESLTDSFKGTKLINDGSVQIYSRLHTNENNIGPHLAPPKVVFAHSDLLSPYEGEVVVESNQKLVSRFLNTDSSITEIKRDAKTKQALIVVKKNLCAFPLQIYPNVFSTRFRWNSLRSTRGTNILSPACIFKLNLPFSNLACLVTPLSLSLGQKEELQGAVEHWSTPSIQSTLHPVRAEARGMEHINIDGDFAVAKDKNFASAKAILNHSGKILSRRGYRQDLIQLKPLNISLNLGKKSDRKSKNLYKISNMKVGTAFAQNLNLPVFEHNKKTFAVKKATATFFSLLRVGAFVTKGDPVFQTSKAIHGITQSGLIVHIGQSSFLLRKTQTMLVSHGAIFHSYSGEFVRPGLPVLTLPFQRLKTGDIVQGIPKVEQLFEARTTKQGRLFSDSLPILLQNLFRRYKNKMPLVKAVRKSLYKIQQVLVDSVQRVYRSQGVQITDKHLEVVVRQMTAKVRVLDGGEAGFFPGELIDLDLIEKLHQSFCLNKPISAIYTLPNYSHHSRSKSEGRSFLREPKVTTLADAKKIVGDPATGCNPPKQRKKSLNSLNYTKSEHLLLNLNLTNGGFSRFRSGAPTGKQTEAKGKKSRSLKHSTQRSIRTTIQSKIRYEPQILGITRSSLESKSFIAASSFQQTSKILSRAAIERQKDFLRGLKESIIVGNLIPVGTGYFISSTSV